jgi:FkbM family methyltransferase
MISIRGLAKPQYLLRPAQLFKRLLQEVRPLRVRETIRLPWHISLEVDTTDTVGAALAHQGLYDLVTTEVVWRLASPGDTSIDIGANIGYFTSLLVARVAPHGQVFAWEPHPQTFQLLKTNADTWKHQSGCAPVTLFQAALSNKNGQSVLSNFDGQEQNTSYSFLESRPGGSGITVTTERLDEFLDSCPQINVMKVDAQFHEAEVFEGAGGHLRSGKIRDIIFEEEAPFPARSHKILIDAGYRIFWFQEHFRGPRVIPPTEPCNLREYDIPPSYLATRAPERALTLLSQSGWRVL